MNRRDFIKSALTVATLAPLAKVAEAAEKGGLMDNGEKGLKVTRRPYRNTDMTMPLLGFGLMRLPQKDGKVDYATAEKMVAKAMAAGCNYFDTAYMYHGGESEKFVGEVLSKYPRESYFLTSKMPIAMMNSAADNERIFKEQLERTKAGYFDFYFLHWLNAVHWEKAQSFGTLEFMKKMQAEGKIRRLGFSFHGEPETLETIAKAHPWDLVQIQLNYLDWELCRSGEQYEVLTKLGIPISVMEPLKGGTLVRLTPESKKIFEQANPKMSIASWGLRYVASLPNIQVVLSGMSAMEHMDDNLKTFSPLVPLSDDERKVIAQALAAYRKSGAVPCTACRYCSPCPFGVDIPRNLALLNQVKGGLPLFHAKLVYDAMQAEKCASSCVACGACKRKCPQSIDIPKYMKEIAETFK
ncbi:MAG: aldo/keto reductase, partial [Victivallales bacterium]|nr:aldo/keto reductase [Victivallales bacterium]